MPSNPKNDDVLNIVAAPGDDAEGHDGDEHERRREAIETVHHVHRVEHADGGKNREGDGKRPQGQQVIRHHQVTEIDEHHAPPGSSEDSLRSEQ